MDRSLAFIHQTLLPYLIRVQNIDLVSSKFIILHQVFNQIHLNYNWSSKAALKSIRNNRSEDNNIQKFLRLRANSFTAHKLDAKKGKIKRSSSWCSELENGDRKEYLKNNNYNVKNGETDEQLIALLGRIDDDQPLGSLGS